MSTAEPIAHGILFSGALDLLNGEEEARIRELCAANDGHGTWPRRWTGHEPRATDPFEEGGQRNFLVDLIDDEDDADGELAAACGGEASHG